MTPEHERQIINRLGAIEAALSPENLFCDNEISRGEAMAKKRRLEGESER